jgi:hypothetical protein
MIYPRDCEIWRACSKKNGRTPNVTVRRTKAGTRMEATDGRILASVHVMAKDLDDGEFVIDPDAFKEAKRRSRKGDDGLIHIKPTGDVEVHNGPSFFEPDGNGCPDSSGARVEGEPVYRLGLNAKLLLELAKALGGEQVLIEVHEEGAHVVKIIGDEAEIVGGRFGLIFPVHPR